MALTTPFLISVRPKRLNWVELFNARPNKFDASKKNFQAQWIIDKDDPDLLDMTKIAHDLLGKLAANRKVSLEGLVPHKDYHWPFLGGEAHIEKMRQSAARAGREWKESYEQQCAGRVVLYTSAPEAYPPILITPVNGEFQQLNDPSARAAAQRSGFFDRGMMALGKVAFMGYDSSITSWGVTAFVNEVCATGKGERIGGAQANVSVYGKPEVSGTTTDFEPTQSSW